MIASTVNITRVSLFLSLSNDDEVDVEPFTRKMLKLITAQDGLSNRRSSLTSTHHADANDKLMMWLFRTPSEAILATDGTMQILC